MSMPHRIQASASGPVWNVSRSMELRRSTDDRVPSRIVRDEPTAHDLEEESIRCPRCGWRPLPSSRWCCDGFDTPESFEGCGQVWDTFATGGRCPGCSHRWLWTSCLHCGEWSLHDDWYERTGLTSVRQELMRCSHQRVRCAIISAGRLDRRRRKTMPQQTETFDAIVVGSGISGGWAAKELTERGLRVLMLERGKNIEHGKDYPSARKAPWEYPHRGGRTREMVDAYPVLQRDYPLNEKNPDWWVNENESPYTEVKRFDWYRGYHVGGRSLTWGRQSYRRSDLDFEANARKASPSTGRSATPTSRRGTTTSSGTPASPDRSKGCRSCPTVSSSRRCRSTASKRRSPAASRSSSRAPPDHSRPRRQPHAAARRRGRCQYRNACSLGCPYGAYFSTQSSTLPAAMATGTAHAEDVRDRDRRGLRPRSPARDRRARARRRHEATTEYTAKVVFLCASTLNSTWLLMRSATDVWPGGLGSSSRRARTQPDGSPLPLRRQRHRRRASGHRRLRPPADRVLHPALPQPRSATSASTCAASATRAAPAGRAGSARSRSSASAAAFKDAMATPGPWRMGATAFGEMLPNHANRITLDERRPTSGACRCSPSTARPARTSG